MVLIRGENTGIKTFMAAWRYSFRQKITLASQLFGLLFIFPSWALYVWIKDSQFGSQPQCNDLVKYVFFFRSVRGTVNWLRILAIVCFSIRMYGSLIIFSAMFSTDNAIDSDDEMDIESRGQRNIISPILWVSSWFPWYFRLTIVMVTHQSRFAVYGIVTTELIVRGISILSPSWEAYLCKTSS